MYVLLVVDFKIVLTKHSFDIAMFKNVLVDIQSKTYIMKLLFSSYERIFVTE